jgi:enoyl-CoA hydratase
MVIENGILLEKRNQIGYITFNRPEKLNPLRNIEYDLLDDLVNECERDDDIHAVIITGKGRSFCVGDDMNGMGDIGRAATTINTLKDHNYLDWELKGLWHPLHQTVKTIYNSGKVYIGAVNGICWIAELLYPMDFVIAADVATFAQADIRIGICPGGGSTQTLTRALGRRRALELLLLPEPISAQEAYRIGIVNKVVPLSNLMAEAEALAKKIIIYSPKAIAMIKRAVTKAQDGIPFEEALRLEQLYSAFTYGHSPEPPGRKEWRERKGK